MVSDILRVLFGGTGNVVRETAEVFRVNAEAADARAAQMQRAALDQMAAEFRPGGRGLFDRVIDALNRLPRPAMALGTLGLLVSAMVDPLWFGERMAGLALVPEPLWWLLGAIVSFYFGPSGQGAGLSAWVGGHARARAAGVGDHRGSARPAPRQPRCRRSRPGRARHAGGGLGGREPRADRLACGGPRLTATM
jgi:hypothetical protein